MISSGPEERGHLNVSTIDGVEGDQTYQADYSIVYREDNQNSLLNWLLTLSVLKGRFLFCSIQVFRSSGIYVIKGVKPIPA